MKRQTSGSVVCPSCGRLVGVSDEKCWQCGRPRPGLWGFAGIFRNLGDDLGFTKLLLGVCGALYLLMMLTDPSAIGGGGLFDFMSPSTSSALRFGATGTFPVQQLGRWWTVLSATWLHGSILHIGFNMMWAYQLVPPVARLYGPGRAIIIYVGSGAIGFVVTTFAGYVPLLSRLPFLQPAALTLGASGAILGLLGAMVYYGKRTGSSMVGRQALGYAVMLIVFGLVMVRVDNWAHLGGFGGGYLLARWLDPLKPERVDHTIAGLVLLGLSGLSIVYSALTGFGIL